jgi:pantothenate kinase-related protein Tda10
VSSSELVPSEPGSRVRAAGRALVHGVVGGSGSGKTTVARETELLVEDLTRLAAAWAG